MNELALFAGAGGGILGGTLLGWRTVCAVEWDAYARDVLVARQNDGCLDPFPIWDDVRTFDGHAWRGRVDVVSGGFPCQDISAAGKGAGITGARSGLWKEMARIVGEVRPRHVWVENSPMLVGRGLAVVLADLARLGFDARWGVVGAHHAGAPHKRDRIWIVADAVREGLEGSQFRCRNDEEGRQEPNGSAPKRREDVADAVSAGKWREQREGETEGNALGNAMRRGLQISQSQPMQKRTGSGASVRPRSAGSSWWATERGLDRVAHGVARRVDRLRCIGNGQVPAVVRLAWSALVSDNLHRGNSK